MPEAPRRMLPVLSAKHLQESMKSALAKFQTMPKAKGPTGALTADARFDRQPPAGGMVAEVFCKILLENDALSKAVKIRPSNAGVGRDRFWITAEETHAMSPSQAVVGRSFPVPSSVVMRLARFHLVDNTRGQSNPWAAKDLIHRQAELEVVRVQNNEVTLHLTGSIRLAGRNKSGPRQYDAHLRGLAIWDTDKKAFTRWDAVAVGDALGEGTFDAVRQGLRWSPDGSYPLGIAIRLLDPNAAHPRMPPHGAMNLADYWGQAK